MPTARYDFPFSLCRIPHPPGWRLTTMTCTTSVSSATTPRASGRWDYLDTEAGEEASKKPEEKKLAAIKAKEGPVKQVHLHACLA